MSIEYAPLRFVGERVVVEFDEPPALEKSPGSPDRFVWKGKTYRITETLEDWRNNTRRGRMTRNMRPEHHEVAGRRGSWGVGRFFFRVRTEGGRIFDLYYDRAPTGSDDRKGSWFLFREMREIGD